MSKRNIVVSSAQYWFDASQTARSAGRRAEALLCMENALNHTENALVSVLSAASFEDRPPVSGREPMTVDQMRRDLDAVRGAR